MKKIEETFNLKGLNKPWKAGGFEGIYATVEYGKEDWFHCRFDKELFSDSNLKGLFDLFKNSDNDPWKGNNKVVVEFDGYSSGGNPVNPIIKGLILENTDF